MASLNTLRTKFGALLSVIIAFALLAFILSLKTEMGFSGNDPKVGEIDGEKINYSEYLDEYEAVKMRNGGVEASTDAQADQLAAATWQALFAKHVLDPGFEELGVVVPEAERVALMRGEIPSQTFYSVFTDPRTGVYNVNAAVQFLAAAESNPQALAAWNDINAQARLERRAQKYMTLVGSAAFANKLEVEQGVAGANKVYAGRFVSKKYSSVPDSLVSVSSGEIKAFYDKNRKMFEQVPSRSLAYVVFEVGATDDDMLALEKEVQGVAAEFAAAEDVKAFVRQNRHGEVSNRYVTAAQLGTAEAEALTAGKPFGPELRNDQWTMARVVEQRMAPDSLGLKVIVLPYTAEKLADSLMTVATTANFSELAAQYSANEELAATGGDVGVYPFSAFEAEVAEALSGAKTGDVVKVLSGSAIQLFNVYRADKATPHYRVATLTYPVEASAATERNIHHQASAFTVNAKGSADAFNEAASAAAVTPRVATLQMGDRAINGLEHSREVARWALEAKVGELSQIFKVGKDYVVAMLTEIDDDEYTAVEKVAPQIRTRLMRDKKYAHIAAQLSGSTLDEAAKNLGEEPAEFDNLTYGSFYVDGVGLEPAFVGAVASTSETGKLSEPVKGLSGLYLFEVTGVTDAENQQTPEAEKVRAEAMSEGMMQQRVLPALQQMAEIEDLSARYF